MDKDDNIELMLHVQGALVVVVYYYVGFIADTQA